MPTTSSHPEAEHRSFWEKKLTRPIDDPFWNKHRPGNRWNCKCSLEATDEDITEIPEDADEAKPQRGLKGNPAKTGQIFDPSHPYFPKNCKECSFNKGIKNRLSGWFWNAKKGDCYECKGVRILRNLPIKELRNEVIRNRLLPTSDNISDYPNLQEQKANLSLTALKRTMKHVYNYEMYEALQFVWVNLHVLTFDRKSDLGENKDFNTKQATDNIIKKRKRGVKYYNVYTFRFRKRTWELKMEKHKNGFEQPYSINKKKS